MNWQKIKFTSPLDFGTDEILINDENLKPDWVEHPAKFTELFLNRNKKTLTIVIGESWTYGEALRNISTGLQKYNLETQLADSFGPKLSLLLDSDYYQYAVPGNCNAYMFIELSRILKYVDLLNYEKINLFVQITEPAREMPIMYKLTDHPLQKLYKEDLDVTFDQWLSEYDDIFLTLLSNEIKKYSNINCVVWKNFCCFQHKEKYENLSILRESWIQFSSRFLGNPIEMQKFQSVGWLHEFQNKFKHIKYSNDMLIKELDKIEAANSFIKNNYLHSNHPNLVGHNLWALNLYNFYSNEF